MMFTLSSSRVFTVKQPTLVQTNFLCAKEYPFLQTKCGLRRSGKYEVEVTIPENVDLDTTLNWLEKFFSYKDQPSLANYTQEFKYRVPIRKQLPEDKRKQHRLREQMKLAYTLLQSYSIPLNYLAIDLIYRCAPRKYSDTLTVIQIACEYYNIKIDWKPICEDYQIETKTEYRLKCLSRLAGIIETPHWLVGEDIEDCYNKYLSVFTDISTFPTTSVDHPHYSGKSLTWPLVSST